FLGEGRVAVVSENVQEELFDDKEKDILGKIVYVGGQPVEVVGVMNSKMIYLDYLQALFIYLLTLGNLFFLKRVLQKFQLKRIIQMNCKQLVKRLRICSIKYMKPMKLTKF